MTAKQGPKRGQEGGGAGESLKWLLPVVLILAATVVLTRWYFDPAEVGTTASSAAGGGGAVAKMPLAERPARQSRRSGTPRASDTTTAARAEAEVIEEKLRWQRENPSPPGQIQLSKEFMANPDNYDPGPGPYVELYEHRSGAMSPWAKPEDAKVTTVTESQGDPPTLKVWLDSVRVTAGQAARICAVVVDESAPVPATMSVRVEATAGGTASLLPMTASSTGACPYMASYTTTLSELGGVRSFDYVVRAEGRTEGGPFTKMVGSSFFVHSQVNSLHPDKATVSIEKGNLMLEIPATVKWAGNYHCHAEVWGGPEGRTPVALAQDRFDNRSPGPLQIVLKFGGRIIRDADVNGPFRIRNVRFRRVDVDPFDEDEPIEVLLDTPPWAAKEFY